MKSFTIKIVNLKSFVLFAILLSLTTVSLMIGTLFLFDNVYSLILIIPFPIFIFLYFQKKSSKEIEVVFDEEKLIIDEKDYFYSEFEGYHIDPNFTMDGLGIKIKNEKTEHFTISKRKKERENVNEFFELFAKKMSEEAGLNSFMKYSDIYKRQIWFLKPLVWFGVIILIGLFGYAIFNGIEIQVRFYLLPFILYTLYLKAYK